MGRPLEELPASQWQKHGGLHGKMVMKPATQMAALNADTGLLQAAGRQQEAGGFDGAGSNHHLAGLELKGASPKRARLHAVHMTAIGVQIQCHN